MCGGQCSSFPYYFTFFENRDFFFPILLGFQVFGHSPVSASPGNIDDCITASGFYRSSVELNTGYETCMSIIFTH